MSGEIRLKIHASHGQLELVEKAIDEMAQLEQWPEELVFKVKLVVEELGLNIIDHGYGNDESQELEFRLVAADDSVTIEFIDEASPFDPLTETPDPDIDAGIEERRIGGLGVYLVREMMDEVKYAREGNRNRLTLVTRL
ncbi:MAG: ATP-binding protein [Gammaproteobacteria bacterium]|jgi:anti-sigma regulatory factor (Ser/Thr protein kinase)|nr:ATP-binding protein [Gammaproteobacteria bacterium]MXW20029.1 ATP-binding protein [Gammaproteobacteria bacterium]MXZ26785.1 ATP-binding protein [Gammaproteobacteria bacterium]MYF59493.1 ATP-binding protein [Gammaproteobacteria bacterium]MYH32216.1 ATP-binding protein [Gammaproteobacteria bacterium]